MSEVASIANPAPRGMQGRGIVILVLGSILAGCAQPAAMQPADKSSTPAAIVSDNQKRLPDECAMRLQELCGPLMLYFNSNFHLPEKLEELRQVPGFENLNSFTCPTSGQPYVYTPQGLPAPLPGWYVIVADQSPAHSGARWAIVIMAPQQGMPLVTNVILLDPHAPPPKPIIVK
jgi:hypothetical protein